MSVEKNYVDTVEDASLQSPNEGQRLSFEGMSEEEMKKFERKRKNTHGACIPLANSQVVVWKIDLHLITALFGIFIFNILDRSNIASARLGGLQTDLHLSDTQYQTAVSIMVSLQLPSISMSKAILMKHSLSATFWDKFLAISFSPV